MTDQSIRIDKLSIVEKDGFWWVTDWVPGPFGRTTIDRYHMAFKSRRDAESLVKAAKRSVPA